MTSKREPLSEKEIAALLAKFGPAPVLSSEDKQGYAMILKGHVAFYRPAHPVAVFLIKQLADTQWEMFRFTRNRTVSVDRRFRNWRDRRVHELEQNNEERERQIKYLQQSCSPDFEAICQLRQRIKTTESTITQLATGDPGTDQENFQIEQAAEFLDKSDKWMARLMARQSNLMQQLEYFCGPTVQRSEVDEAEFKEVQSQEFKQIPAPPMAPPEVLADDITAQNRSEPVEQPKE